MKWIIEYWDPETGRNAVETVEAEAWFWARLLFLARRKRAEPPIGIRPYGH